MEVKKSPKADLENKRSTWLLVGYVAVLAVMFEPTLCLKRKLKFLLRNNRKWLLLRLLLKHPPLLKL